MQTFFGNTVTTVFTCGLCGHESQQSSEPKLALRLLLWTERFSSVSQALKAYFLQRPHVHRSQACPCGTFTTMAHKKLDATGKCLLIHLDRSHNACQV